MRVTFITWLLCLISFAISQQSDGTEPTRTALIPSAPPKPTATDSFRIDPKKLSKEVHNFFRAYGWLRRNETIQDDQIPKAIRKIQRAIRHPETGVYDSHLNALMSRPRCGTEQNYTEAAANDESDLHKRYVLWGPKWDHSPVTYRFINYTADLDVASQQNIIRFKPLSYPQDPQYTNPNPSQAFAKWSSTISLKIAPAPSNAAKADINILFRALGPSQTAYGYTTMVADGVALSPGLININFNDDYPWSDDRLFNFTAVHEIGHALGLSHSTVEDAVMFAYYYEGLIRPLHPDDKAAIHSVYGWNAPRWSRIDSNAATKNIIQVSSRAAAKVAPVDGIYQLRSTGQILRYTSPAGPWTALDTNKNVAQIAGASGALYKRHVDGSVYLYTGAALSSPSWQLIGAASENVIDIVAAADQVYARRKDGWIVRWTGTASQQQPQPWSTIQQPSSPSSAQIAVTDSKTLWNLLANGDLVRSEWPYTESSWQIVDINPSNAQIAVGGDEFYKLQSDGVIVWLDLVQYYWSVIEDAGSVGVYAVGEYVYSRHDDGSLWRYTGTPLVWEELDDERECLGVVGERDGGVYEMSGGGEVWKLVS